MKKRKSIAIFLFILATFFLSNSPVLALDDDDERLSLKGLKGVYIWIHFLTDEIKRLKDFGLSEEIIWTDTELKLRKAGISVASTKEDLYKIPGIPQLIIGVGGCGHEHISFTARVSVAQGTFLSREPSLKLVAQTWSRALIGYGETDKDIVNQIRDSVKGLVDFFINDYISVNPNEGK